MALATEPTAGAKIRAQLKHLVIDVDGHHLEFQPTVDDYLRDAMGPQIYAKWQQRDTSPPPTLEERRAWRLDQQAWWGSPAVNTLDLRPLSLSCSTPAWTTSESISASSTPPSAYRPCATREMTSARRFAMASTRFTPSNTAPMPTA